MMTNKQIKNPMTQLIDYIDEYQILSNIYKPDLDFNSSFELNRKIKTLDRKILLLVRKIDPLYESVIKNNFYKIESNVFLSILHRISLLESIINDIDQTIIHFQI